MRKILLLMIMLGSSLTLTAALPPLWQSANEIKAVLESPEFADALPSGDVITDIAKNHDGYTITTNKRKVNARISYHKEAKIIGPAQFSVSFDKPSVKWAE